MDLGLKGRKALVTGGSRGIGHAIARSLAAEGCALYLASLTPSSLEEAAEKLRQEFGIFATAVPADLSKAEEAERLGTLCKDADILVNCAGAIDKGRFETVDDAKLRAGFDLKLFGYLNLSRSLYVSMRERGQGVIINIIGIAGQRPPFDGVPGAAANAALMAFTTGLGSESLEHGVRVLAVNPGPTQTERWFKRLRERARKELGDESRYEELLGNKPFAKPQYIGDAVAFLASDRAGFITGTMINVDGGLSARSPLRM